MWIFRYSCVLLFSLAWTAFEAFSLGLILWVVADLLGHEGLLRVSLLVVSPWWPLRAFFVTRDICRSPRLGGPHA